MGPSLIVNWLISSRLRVQDFSMHKQSTKHPSLITMRWVQQLVFVPPLLTMEDNWLATGDVVNVERTMVSSMTIIFVVELVIPVMHVFVN